MPEGPSIIILKEAVASFKGKKILEASGNARIDTSLFVDQPIVDICSWGKHFLLVLPACTIRIHFLLFGSYSIDEPTKAGPRLYLRFARGALYFYSCSVRVLQGHPGDIYDWSGDVMNDAWNARKARKKLLAKPETMVCDALLDQDIFAGVGNIIKNEVLFRIRVHPESRIGGLPSRKLGEMIREARNYSYDFLEWKKEFTLKKHWLAHTKKICPRCHILFIKVQHLGKTLRRAFFCNNCQIWYMPGAEPAKKEAPAAAVAAPRKKRVTGKVPARVASRGKKQMTGQVPAVPAARKKRGVASPVLPARRAGKIKAS